MFHYNPDNKILQMLSLYFDLTVLAALWIVTSVPIVTVGASTTALYRVLFQMTASGGTTGIVRTFFSYWRIEWRRSTLVWVLLLGILLLTGADLYVCIAYRPEGVAGMILWAGTFLAAVLTLCLTAYVFPIAARFDCTIPQVFANAVRFTAGEPGPTLALIGLSAAMSVSAIFLIMLSVFLLGPLLYLSVKQLNQIFAPVVAHHREEPVEKEEFQ